MITTKNVLLLALVASAVLSVVAVQPNSDSNTAQSSVQQLQPPKQSESSADSSSESSTAPKKPTDSSATPKGKGKGATVFEDTDEYIFLVCVRKIMHGPKGFCERPEVKAVLPTLSKVPEPKKLDPEEVRKSHMRGEARQAELRMNEMERLWAEAHPDQAKSAYEKQLDALLKGPKGAKIAANITKAFDKLKGKAPEEVLGKLLQNENENKEFLTKSAGKGALTDHNRITVAEIIRYKHAGPFQPKHSAVITKKTTVEQLKKLFHEEQSEPLEASKESSAPKSPTLSKLQSKTAPKAQREAAASLLEMMQEQRTPYENPWDKAKVKYRFEGVAPNDPQSSALYGLYVETMAKFENNTCIRFRPQNAHGVGITTLAGGPRDQGSFSQGIGAASSRVQIATHMTDPVTVEHEFGHLFGLQHTFTRADASQYVTIDRTKCDNYFERYECLRQGQWHRMVAKAWKPWLTANSLGHIAAHDFFTGTAKDHFSDFDNVMTALPADVQVQMDDVARLWRQLPDGHPRKQALAERYLDLKDEKEFLEAMVNKWAEIKAKQMQRCLDGWFYQYERSPTSTDYGTTFDFKSVMMYSLDTNMRSKYQCMVAADGVEVPDRIGQRPASIYDFAAINYNHGCRGLQLVTCHGSTEAESCKEEVRYVHPDWTIKFFLKDMRNWRNVDIDNVAIHVKGGTTWDAVQYEPTETIASKGWDHTVKVRVCSACAAPQQGDGQQN
eukprot:TRINITY_DN67102_c4_g21_i1.p1 TRINITY_DN67102_c4_g21~~TRINITY_DN67102_c4_g21_i1.p1  ORF type:complete len:726 (-),score=393.82 TRINITY_DN67102_c4_g21_i1:172-2349(-)